jgi:hypothetical protein
LCFCRHWHLDVWFTTVTLFQADHTALDCALRSGHASVIRLLKTRDATHGEAASDTSDEEYNKPVLSCCGVLMLLRFLTLIIYRNTTIPTLTS